MPAIDRYTGVLYDALDARTLSEPARSVRQPRRWWCTPHCSAWSVPLDPIPAYRLSHDSRRAGNPPSVSSGAARLASHPRGCRGGDRRPPLGRPMSSSARRPIGTTACSSALVSVGDRRSTSRPQSLQQEGEGHVHPRGPRVAPEHPVGRGADRLGSERRIPARRPRGVALEVSA